MCYFRHRHLIKLLPTTDEVTQDVVHATGDIITTNMFFRVGQEVRCVNQYVVEESDPSPIPTQPKESVQINLITNRILRIIVSPDFRRHNVRVELEFHMWLSGRGCGRSCCRAQVQSLATR